MQRIRHSIFLCMTLCTVLLLGACTATIQSVTPEVPTPIIATTEPSDLATPDPDTAPTDQATPEATEEATEAPSQEGDDNMGNAGEADNQAGSDIAMQVRQQLMQRLQVDADEIEVVSVEEVEWSDACLGVASADEICAQVITPGYRVILEAAGNQYEYHTNADGSSIRLADAPEASIQDPLIIWEARSDGCTTAQVGTTGVAFGPCGGVQMLGNLVVPERGDQLAELVATYAPFTARTEAGLVDFYGSGTVEATPAQQRMIAEWARIVVQEAESGRSGASWGLALAWHREGGIAGFCEDVTAYVTGRLYVTSCRGQEPETIVERWLSADELEQIYTWQDQYAPFEYVQSDDAQADSMTVRLVFSANGDTFPDADEQQAIVDFAADLYLQASQ